MNGIIQFVGLLISSLIWFITVLITFVGTLKTNRSAYKTTSSIFNLSLGLWHQHFSINSNSITGLTSLEEVIYDESATNEIYVRSFDLILWTDKETYDYLNNDYDFLFEKYDRYTINLDDFKFYTLSNKDFSRLSIH